MTTPTPPYPIRLPDVFVDRPFEALPPNYQRRILRALGLDVEE